MTEPSCENCPFQGSPQVCGEGYEEKEGKLFVCEDEHFTVIGVAMAPAVEEIRQGRVLIGPSGQFLRKQLHQMGVSKYYLCNVLLCQIPEDANEVQIAQAALCCRERLVEEIKSKSPLLVVGMGELPLHTLTPYKFKITEVEGRVLPSDVGAFLPLAHPAYYLRRPDEAFDFIEALRSGLKILDGTYQQAVNVTFTLVTTDNLAYVLEELNRHEHISIDTETTGFNAYGIEPNEILEMGLAVSHDHSYIIPKELIPAFKELLETHKGLFWNALFDYSFIRAGTGICPYIYFDGMLAHYCLDERPTKHGLKRCARIYTGSEDWEKGIEKYLPRKKDSSYALIPHEVRHQYLAYDAARTYQMWEVLKSEVEDNWVFNNVLMPACRMFADLIHKGIRLEPNAILQSYIRLQAELGERREELKEIAGTDFNVLSPKQAAEVLFERLGLLEDPHFGRSTARPVLEVRKDEHPIIERIIEYREQAKSAGTYIAGIAHFMDNDFRIHPKFKLFGTVTGRISCEEPSVMNIKGESFLKAMYLPEPGMKFADYDASQMELRWYSIYADDNVLREILLKEGDAGDPHFQIGLIAFGDEKKSRELRTATKMVVFGRVYLRGFQSMIDSYGETVAKEICDAMDRMMPNHKKYVKDIREQIRTQGYVKSYFGRVRRFPLITQENRGECERQAVNMPIQSAGSDLNILNLLYLYNNRQKWGIWPMWPIHDSLNVSIPPDPGVALEIKKALEENALNVMEGKMPFRYKMEVGDDWSMGKEEKSTYYKRLMREGKDMNIPKRRFEQ